MFLQIFGGTAVGVSLGYIPTSLNDIVVLIMIITRIDLFLSGFCRKNVTIKSEKTMKIVNAVSVLGTGTLQEH
jgi:hypothetical protein